MNKRKLMKTLAAGLCTIMAMGFLAGCGDSSASSASSSSGASGKPLIRVGYMPYYSSVPIQVIQEEKLDEKYGFEMKAISFPSGGPMAEALGANQWDVGPIGAGGMVAIPTYDAKLIADMETEMDGIWVMARPDSDIVKAGKTLKDYPELIGSKDTLKGKTILGTVGNISQYVGLDYLKKFGLSLDDVNFVHMETAQIYTSFVSGNGDIACTGSPSAAMKLKDEGYVVVGGLKQQGIPQQDAMLVSSDFYKNNYDDAVHFMEAWFEATAKLNADPKYEFEQVKKFYAASGRTDFDDKSVQDECDWNVYTDAANVKDKKLGKWMTDLVQFMVDQGTMEQETVDAMKTNIKDDVLNEAIKALGK